MSWLLCNHTNPRNLGDQLTSPALYDSRFTTLDRCDIEAIHTIDLARYSGVIFGGGGMLYGESEKRMASVAARLPTIVLACGINESYDTPVTWPDWLQQCCYVALRDWNSPYDWCPCLSCLHPAFDHVADSFQHAQIWYGHVASLRDRPYPSLTHDKQPAELSAVLGYMASAATVITDSYHGAYWAMLLGRDVRIETPRSNKFKALPPAGKNMLQAARTCCRAALDKVATIANL